MTFILPPARTITLAPKAASLRTFSASVSSVRAFQFHTRSIAQCSSTTPVTSGSNNRRAIVQRRSIVSGPHSSFLSSNSASRATFATTSGIMTEPTVHELFEPVTGSWQYVVADPATSNAVIIDPVLNYDAAKGVISTESADALVEMVTEKGYEVEMILETHIHADHMTAASYIQATLAKSEGHKPLIGIGSRIKNTQKLFGDRYGIAVSEYVNAFDCLWKDDEDFKIGSLTARAIHLPGHTPDHMGYKIGSNVFVGDSIFHVDIGSARADFPGGSADAIYNSGRKLLDFPDHTRIWVGHDYPPEGRDAPVPYVTVKQQREENKHLKDGTLKEEFVAMRHKRDETLAAPRLIHPSLQVNIRGGRLPAPTASGLRMVYLPLKVPDPAW